MLTYSGLRYLTWSSAIPPSWIGRYVVYGHIHCTDSQRGPWEWACIYLGGVLMGERGLRRTGLGANQAGWRRVITSTRKDFFPEKERKDIVDIEAVFYVTGLWFKNSISLWGKIQCKFVNAPREQSSVMECACVLATTVYKTNHLHIYL